MPVERQRKRVLIVDDNFDLREYLRLALKSEYDVHQAKSGYEAIDVLPSVYPDLIISDLMMPNGDGFEVLQYVRKDPSMDFIPVVLLSAKAEIESKLKALGIGADDYVTKPFDIYELKGRIAGLLALRMRLKDHLQSDINEVVSLPMLHLSPSAKSQTESFISRVGEQLKAQLTDSQLSVESLAGDLGMSRTSFYRKVVEVYNQSPAELIMKLRLDLAKESIKKDLGTFSEIAYSCGFSSLSHFSKSFRKNVGQSPSEFKDKLS